MQRPEPHLLYGRLAQPVRASELTWTLDTCEVWDATLEETVERRVLCIEIPKKAWPAAQGVQSVVKVL